MGSDLKEIRIIELTKNHAKIQLIVPNGDITWVTLAYIQAHDEVTLLPPQSHDPITMTVKL